MSARAAKRRREAKTRPATRARPALLEEDSVRPETTDKYIEYYTMMEAWHLRRGGAPVNEESIDAVLTEWMNHDLLEGGPSDRGSNMLAAVKYHCPAYARRGGKSLARASQALRRWRLRAPLGSRLPLPWEAVCLLATQL